MKKLNLPSFYAYSLCLIMIIAFIIAGGQLIQAVLNYILPNPQALNSYIPPNATLTDEAKTLYEQASLQLAQRRQIAEMLAGALMLLFIVPLYFYHWKFAGKYKNSDGVTINVHTLYFYLASFITFIVGFIALMTAINTLIPYLMHGNGYLPPIEVLYGKDPNGITAMTITVEQIQGLIEKGVRDSYFPRNAIISELTFFIVALPLYLFHWVKTKALNFE